MTCLFTSDMAVSCLIAAAVSPGTDVVVAIGREVREKRVVVGGVVAVAGASVDAAEAGVGVVACRVKAVRGQGRMGTMGGLMAREVAAGSGAGGGGGAGDEAGGVDRRGVSRGRDTTW